MSDALDELRCPQCALAFAVDAFFIKQRRNDHGTFYCPSGHGMSYTGKTEADINRELKEQLSTTVAENIALKNQPKTFLRRWSK
jgi:hypothetical protein